MLNQQLLDSMSLEESRVTMLPKPQKYREKANNYRPISLTSCSAKISESVFKNFILCHSEATKVFGAQQSAYRENRCATDNIIALVKNVSIYLPGYRKNFSRAD